MRHQSLWSPTTSPNRWFHLALLLTADQMQPLATFSFLLKSSSSEAQSGKIGLLKLHFPHDGRIGTDLYEMGWEAAWP